MRRIAFLAVLSLVLVAAWQAPASADGFGKIIAAINQVLGGQVDGSGATTGQALVKQSDGSWKPGTVGAAFPLLAPNGTVGAPSYAFTNESTLGIYRVGAGVLGVSGALDVASGSFTVDAAGNVITGGSVTYATNARLQGATNRINVIISSGNSFSFDSSSGAVRFDLYNNPIAGAPDNTGTEDTYFYRSAAGEWSLGTTRSNAAGSWKATNGTLTGTLTLSANTILSNFGTGILGLSDSTTGTAFRVFNTTDSTSSPTNSEWVELSWAANLLTFQSSKSGTGTLRNLAITFPNLTLAANTLTVTTFAAGQGAAGTPSLMFSANTDRGFFNDTTNTGIGFTVGGAQKATLTSTVFQLLSTVNMQCGGVYRSADNAAATPGYTFTNNTDRGIYNDTANSGVGVSVTGTERLFVGATLVWVTGSANFQVDGNTTLVGSTTAKGTGSANGQTLKIDTATELLTLSTSGTTTDTAANLLPAGAMIVAVDCRITTTITTATNWSVGDATVAARFSPVNSTLTSGTTSIGLDQLAGTGTSSSRQNAAAKVRITTTGTPGAGAIRITVHYIQLTAPTS